MSKPYIEYIHSDGGDWHVIRLNVGEDMFYEGHDIPAHVWINLLETLGFSVDNKLISDDDMECGNY